MKKRQYWYRLPGAVYAFRTEECYRSIKEVKSMISLVWFQGKKLPRGVEIW